MSGRIEFVAEALTDLLSDEDPGLPELAKRYLIEALASVSKAEAICEAAQEGMLTEPSEVLRGPRVLSRGVS